MICAYLVGLLLFYLSASGEPPIVLSSGVLFALKQAVEAAKQDCSDKKQIQFVTPGKR